MTDRPRRPRRVQLSTPGSSEKMMQKASESKADHVFLDLEDAVAPSQKRDARKKIVQALTPGVYLAMNGRCFEWDRVRKNRETGVFEAI